MRGAGGAGRGARRTPPRGPGPSRRDRPGSCVHRAHGAQMAGALGDEHPLTVAARRALAVSRGTISELSDMSATNADEAARGGGARAARPLRDRDHRLRPSRGPDPGRGHRTRDPDRARGDRQRSAPRTGGQCGRVAATGHRGRVTERPRRRAGNSRARPTARPRRDSGCGACATAPPPSAAASPCARGGAAAPSSRCCCREPRGATAVTQEVQVMIAENAATRLGIKMALGDGVSICAEADDAEQAIRAAKRLQPDICLVGRDVAGRGMLRDPRHLPAPLPNAAVVVLADVARRRRHARRRARRRDRVRPRTARR